MNLNHHMAVRRLSKTLFFTRQNAIGGENPCVVTCILKVTFLTMCFSIDMHLVGIQGVPQGSQSAIGVVQTSPEPLWDQSRASQGPKFPWRVSVVGEDPNKWQTANCYQFLSKDYSRGVYPRLIWGCRTIWLRFINLYQVYQKLILGGMPLDWFEVCSLRVDLFHSGFWLGTNLVCLCLQ